MPRYPDCESCAFYQIEAWICDSCEEADQWEPADEDLMSFSGESRHVVKTRKSRLKEAA